MLISKTFLVLIVPAKLFTGCKMKKFLILNATPDSFSDGGLYKEIDFAVFCKNAATMGAFAIDIGAASTRPGALDVSCEQEIERLSPIIKNISANCELNNLALSIDTINYNTAVYALQNAKIDYINNVAGLNDNRFISLLQQNLNLKYIYGHNLGVPANPSIAMPQQAQDMIDVILNDFKRAGKIFTSDGISLQRIIFDIGIGFGKNAEQSMYLIKNAAKLQADIKAYLPGSTLMVGHSRKRFLKHYAGLLTTALPCDKAQENQILDALTKLTTNVFLYDIDFVRLHSL